MRRKEFWKPDFWAIETNQADPGQTKIPVNLPEICGKVADEK